MNIFDAFQQWRAANEAAVAAAASNAATAQTGVTSLDARVTVLEGGGVLTQYTSNATWTKPGGYQPDDLFTIICICGGDGGGRPGNTSPSANLSPNPGRSGGYVSRQVKYSVLASSYSMTIGAAGAGATSNGTLGASGGTTSFGALVVGVQGAGAIYKDDGSYAPSVPPGDGGRGAIYNTNTGAMNSDPGESGPFALGGAAGYNGVGGDGQSAPAGTPSGGGGGGGGGCTGTGAASAGGAGGFPGGGGGTGGIAGTNPASGGDGAAGCIYVISPY